MHGGGEMSDDAEAGASPETDEAERPFTPLLILSAMTVAFAHGGNDLGNSIGPLAAILEVILSRRVMKARHFRRYINA